MTTTTVSTVFDYSGAMDRMGHDAQLFRDMVDYLHRDGPAWMDEVKTAATAGDLPRVQYRAHSLKGLISNFGADRAWHAAAQLEEMARARRTDGMALAVETLAVSLRELIDALSPYRSSGDGQMPQPA